ncbi:uncharacterized protein EKO05_0002567 [Ascochyta rabiei]|uniref:Uncharacterized protein n=1 Tax=Didymella rabiei TaxID=5454 RepID=A0A163ILI7_DIDRA|nr:uncharacterized protein EKO05_0002567 [Ascochyta rabiei]KZM25804.1 hypothetical protein ST47_g3065 [Ascochyta rabiei]UPX11989.1 hypothetical protein EKO05_0002567 [Ascochyta rabiei]
MFSLTRCRRASAPRVGERMRFAELPDDILILILSACHVDDLLTLRQTSRRARSLISEYTNTIAPSVARTTFPQNHNLLAHRPLRYTVQWLEDLIPRQLAAILVDRHRIAHDFTQQRYGIPAEDTYGDELRARIANGWRVLRRLADIAKTVHSSSAPDTWWPASEFSLRLMCPSRKLEQSRQKEDAILKRRLAYIESIPLQDAKDYKLMFMLLSSSFRTSISNIGEDHKPWVFDWGSGIDGQRLFRKGNSWLSWFVLAEGPDLFWKQWWTLPHNSPSARHYIRDRAVDVWARTPRRLADHQRDHARKIQEAVNNSADVCTDFVSVNPIPYFTQYAECRLARWKGGMLPAKETMSHVPFHVEFRCPEELVQQHKLFLQGKQAANTKHVEARG